MKEQIEEIYGNRVRVRVCGLCWNGPELLLIDHHSLSETHFWSPPGGGVEFGENLENSLKREFQEETGLTIRVGKFMFGCEFIQTPLHAIELFFSVSVTGGKLIAGHDPEIQLIRDARFIPYDTIQNMAPSEVHRIFQLAERFEDLSRLSGFYRI